MPLSLMGYAGWRLQRARALDVRRNERALPTTVQPVLPSLQNHSEQSVVCTLQTNNKQSKKQAQAFTHPVHAGFMLT